MFVADLIDIVYFLFLYLILFFFNDTSTTEIYTLSLHALFRSGITVNCRSRLFSVSITVFYYQIQKEKSEYIGFDRDRKSTRLNSSHVEISYAVFCLKKKKKYNLYKNTSGKNTKLNRISILPGL